MSTDQKKPETILVSPFAPEQSVLVGPFSTEETTTYEVSPFKITISKAERSSHAVMGGDAPLPCVSPASTLSSIEVLMDYLAKHPEELQELITKLQNLANN